MHIVRSSHLLPLPTDNEETQEALRAAPVLKDRQNLLVNDAGEKETIVMFSCKNNLQFF